MRQRKLYVFILVYIDENWEDIAGNKYPVEGFIRAKEFTDDIDISCGLYGILWGKTCYLCYEKIDKGNWVVVKTEFNEDLIRTDSYYNRYKFRQGWVIYAGNIRSAAKFILKHKDDSSEELLSEASWLQPEEIAGSRQWFKKVNINALY